MADSAEQGSASVMDKLRSYLKTLKGRILAAEIVLSLVITICYGASYHSGYLTLSVCEMVFAAIFFAVFMTDSDKAFPFVSWLWSDFIRAVIGAVLYLITSLICVIGGAGDAARIAGGVFGLVAGILFGYDSFLICRDIKSKRQHAQASTDEKV